MLQRALFRVSPRCGTKFIRPNSWVRNGSGASDSSDPKEFETVVFYGRTMKEYEIMFDMKVGDLDKTHKVLDCPGGPSSFQRQGREKYGLDVTSVDPMYSTPQKELVCAMIISWFEVIWW